MAVEVDTAAAARRAEELAQDLRLRAGLVRASADLDWCGPGAAEYRDRAGARWVALLSLADLAESVAANLWLLADRLEVA